MDIHIHPEVETFIKWLDRHTIAKVLRTIDLLERFGNKLGLPHSKSFGQGLFELRVRGQQEVRVFYAFHKSVAVLLTGFVKKSQQTPGRELLKARERMRDLT